MNYVSFSVYGSDPKYLVGALENLALVKELLPGWFAVFYISPQAHSIIGADLLDERSLVIIKNERSNYAGMTWRFEAIGLPNASHVIFRDTDSRITVREISAVREWVASSKVLHIMRDHPLHGSKILGGMWGIFAPKAKYIPKLLGAMDKKDAYGMDQEFLAANVYKYFRHSRLVHDSFFLREISAKAFPIPRGEGEYVGEVIDEHGNFDSGLREFVTKVETSARRRFQVAYYDIRVRSILSAQRLLLLLTGRARN
jgi:protein O-GlcNAc transferase